MNKSHVKTYLISDQVSGMVKIGKAVNVESRIISLQCGSASKLKLIHLFDANIERLLHVKFKDKRKHGEWFDVSPDEIILFAESLNLSKHQIPISCIEKEDKKRSEKIMNELDERNLSHQISLLESEGYKWFSDIKRMSDENIPYWELERNINPLIKREYDMINMIVFNKTEAMLRVSMNIHDYDCFGPSLPKEHFDVMRSLQRANTVYIEDGIDFQIRKQKLTDLFNRKHKQKLIDEIHLLEA